MSKKRHADIIYRFKGNPVITMDDLSFRASDICNAGAVKIDDTYLLLVTVLAATSGTNIRIPSSVRKSGITSHNACVEVYGSDEPSPKKSKEESVDK